MTLIISFEIVLNKKRKKLIFDKRENLQLSEQNNFSEYQ